MLGAGWCVRFSVYGRSAQASSSASSSTLRQADKSARRAYSNIQVDSAAGRADVGIIASGSAMNAGFHSQVESEEKK